MGDRVTKVSLVAQVSSYLAGMDAAAKKTREMGSEAEKLAGKKQAIAELGQGVLAVGAVAGVATGLAIARFAEFDSAISNVKAATQESAENMGLLRDAALEAGASTVYTAVEAAGAIEELGKAGLSTEQILSGGLNGALSLAAAGQLGVAEAAQTTAIAIKQFGLNGNDAAHVADLLAAGAGKAVGDVDDLGQALNQAGLVANGAGFSIEETTGVLAAFADAGLLGSDAGTSLKTAIIALQAPSTAAKNALEQYGISVYDANGEMAGFSDLAGQLESKLGGLTDEQRNATLATIFGNDALRSANVLYEQGATGIQQYIDQTNDSGYAAQVAADRLDNLAGDVEKLGGAFDTALIKTGSGANNILRDLTQGVTGLVDGIGDLPQPVLDAGLALGGVAAAAGLVGGTALLGVPKLAAFKAGLDTLGVSGKKAGLGIGGATLALTGFTLAIGAVAESKAKAATTASAFEESFDGATGAITDYTRELVAKELAERNAFAGAERAGISQKEFTDAVLAGGDALAKVRQQIEDSGTFFDVEKGLSINAAMELGTALDTAGQKFRDTKAATDESTQASEEAAEGFGSVTAAATTSSGAVADLKNAIAGFGAAQLDVNAASRDFEAAIDGVTDSLETNGATLDVGTEAGRANSAALDQIASSALGLAAATLEQTGSQDEASVAIQRGRDELIRSLAQYGIVGQAAEDYADKLGLIPSDISTAVRQIGFDEAILKAQAVARAIREIPGQRDVVINQTVRETGAARGAVTAAFADGGTVPGRRSLRDNQLIWAASGEEIIRTEMAERYRPMLKAMNAGTYPRQAPPVYLPALPHYASGGTVGGGSYTAPAINVVVSPKGGIDLLKYVDVKIQEADASSALTLRMGKQRRY